MIIYSSAIFRLMNKAASTMDTSPLSKLNKEVIQNDEKVSIRTLYLLSSQRKYIWKWRNEEPTMYLHDTLQAYKIGHASRKPQ